MMRPGFSRRRRMLAGVIVAALALVGAATTLRDSSTPTAAPTAYEGTPGFAASLAQLKQALPGNDGMAAEGPGAAADSEFMERAYPDNTISVAEMEGARDAFTDAAGEPFRAGEGDGRWRSIGPSRALYPFTERRTSFNYVPNAYVAGGRTTSIALSDRCRRNHCEAYITPAGGGVWHTKDILRDEVRWRYLGGPLGINAAGAVTIDTNDRNRNTVYVGTGEANICGSGCVAGTGLYKSTNGGRSWRLLGKDVFAGKGIGEIVVKPGDSKTLYVATTTALRGMSSVCCTGVTRPVPGIAKWGLYKSTDGGSSWSFIHNGAATTAACTGDLNEFNNLGTCSPRGVRHVELDPSNPDIVYAASYARGIWRSNDAGATWVQLRPSINDTIIQSRSDIAVTTLPSGATRMYVLEGNNGTNASQLVRSDSVATGTPVWINLTGANETQPGWAWRGMCDPQCWYDMFVYTPKGFPDVVYAGGDYAYGENTANKRGVVLSTDAGVTGTDMTFDGTDPLHPNALHPDQHDLVTIPGRPFLFIETNDGGVMRSSGEFVNRSSWCDSRPLTDTADGATAEQKRERCRQMLSRIPSKLEGLNEGLNTLQFQSLSISPHNTRIRQGGTQDNGTWQTNGSRVTWENTIIGDGGQSGFDVGIPEFRFHTYTTATVEVNFNHGDVDDWIVTWHPLNHGGEFYAPAISDPVVSKTMFAGTSRTAYRTQTAGLGTRTVAEALEWCSTWRSTFPQQCGDWAELGQVRLTDPAWGDRAAGNVAAVERTAADTSTAWAATTTGRVFVTKNVDAPGVDEFPPATGTNVRRVAKNVTWSRIDLPTTPNRFVSSIHVDPKDGNRAWVSYSGYSVNTPTTPGHVFEVRFDPVSKTATWTNLDHNLADLPITDLVRDDETGDLFAATDFGALRLPAGSTTWRLAARGMPNVEIAGLTILPKERQLYAATHGLSAWLLDLGDLDDGDEDEDDDDDEGDDDDDD